MATNLTRKERLSIIHLRKEGYSIMDIAAFIGRSRSTIKRLLKENKS